MKLSSDADILGLIIDIPENKELGIYVKHLYDDQWDYEVEIDRELGDDTLMHDTVESEVDISGSVGEEFVEVEGVDVRDTATSSHDSDEVVSGPVNVFEERNMKKEGFKFVTGMVFNSSKEFKWEVEYHEALRQKDVKFKKNEARRTYNHVHSCENQDVNKVVTSEFLAKFFKDEFRVNTDWGRGPFQEHVKAKFNCQLTRNQAFWQKKKALKQIDGQDSEQFKLLNDYCEELMRSNPGTTVKMKLDSEFIVNGRPRFVRLYICFGACKEGFIRGGRPIIGLDGRWMPPERFSKGRPTTECYRFRWFCARHMHANFLKDGFTEHVLKMQFWAVCKANIEAEYHARMEKLKTLNVKAFEWLSARNPKHYCRAFFSTFPKCDLLLNNLCESWNSCILNFRDKPVQTLCEKIRIYLMTRMQKNRDKMRNYSSMVYPKILKLIEEGKDKCAIFSAYKAVDDIYQVDDDNFKPFKEMGPHCIPCSHAIAAIRKKGALPELYVHHCYSVEQYLRAYGPAILPIRAEELWHKTDLPPPLPPKYKAQPQPHSHVPQQPVSHQVEENHEVQGQFEDVVVETQVPDFVLNEMKGMSSQPSQATGGDNAISTVSNFISTATTAAAANEPTSARKKYLTIGGIKYTYSEAYLIRK
nr:uncharacterized protein LOC109150412 [Ipomoea batatas]